MQENHLIISESSRLPYFGSVFGKSSASNRLVIGSISFNFDWDFVHVAVLGVWLSYVISRRNVCTFSQAAVRGKGLDLKQKHNLRNADSKFHDSVDFRYLWQPKRPGFTAHIAFHLIYSLYRDSVHTAEFGLKNDPICLSLYIHNCQDYQPI